MFGTRKISDSLLHAFRKKKIYSRRFTMIAIGSIELLSLAVSDLDKMRLEFPDEYK